MRKHGRLLRRVKASRWGRWHKHRIWWAPQGQYTRRATVLVEIHLKTNQNLTASYSSFSDSPSSSSRLLELVFVCEINFPSLVSVHNYSYYEAHKNHGFACSRSHCPALTFHCCHRQHKRVVGWDGCDFRRLVGGWAWKTGRSFGVIQWCRQWKADV